MLDAANPVHPEVIASALDWWLDAGVDALIDEAPVAWLARGKAEAAPKADAIRKPVTTAPVLLSVEAMPNELADFTTWLMASPGISEAGPPAQRVPPSGDAASAIMVVIDMPEQGDVEAGHMLSGEAGEIFDRMLAKINLTRETIYLTALCPARTPGGMLSEEAVAALAPILRHHIDLIGPKRLWLMGQTVSRALIGADAMPGIGSLRKFNHEGRIVEAVASFSPRFLLQQPKRRAAALLDMQVLIEGI